MDPPSTALRSPPGEVKLTHRGRYGADTKGKLSPGSQASSRSGGQRGRDAEASTPVSCEARRVGLGGGNTHTTRGLAWMRWAPG